MKVPSSNMRKEIEQIPNVVKLQIEEALKLYEEAGRKLAASNPATILTCARGTSDQAALYLKYLMEIYAGVPVASVGPSIASLYGANLKTNHHACITISQSGGSPDLVQLQKKFKQSDALTVALLNTINSPVGNGADIVLPLLAGKENAVAATKSFVASLVGVAALVGGFSGDRTILDAIQFLPDVLEETLQVNSTTSQMAVSSARSLYVLSRGPSLAAAGEAALKIKETCRIHAEVYSAAEAMHGPIVLAERGFSVIAFCPQDAGADSVNSAVQRFKECGARVVTFGVKDCDIKLPEAPHPALAPIVQITAFYAFVEQLSLALGESPDSPPGLLKVTETV